MTNLLVIGIVAMPKPPTPSLHPTCTCKQSSIPHQPLCMSKRLVRALRIPRLLLRVRVKRHLIAFMPNKRTGNSLISTSSLLHRYSQAPPAAIIPIPLTLGLSIPEPALIAAMMWVALARTTAYAKQPEERSSPGKDYTQPHDNHRFASELNVDIVRIQQRAQRSQ